MLSRPTITSLVGIAFAVAGCATSHVMMGQPRPPISPDLVTVYFHPPQTKYDEIAMIDTSSKGGFGFTAQGKTDVVIRRLKEEAAKLGANGILLQGIGNESGGSVSSGFGQASVSGNHAYGSGVGFSGNVVHKAGSGIAIYVEPPPASN
jgi:hypothetical protein